MDNRASKTFLVITDIHGHVDCLMALTGDLKKHYDGIICLGDAGLLCHDIILENYEKGDNCSFIIQKCNAVFREIVKILRNISPNVYFVPGNHDQVWMTDPYCYKKILETYGVHIVHNKVIRLGPNLVIAGSGGTTSTYDQTERRRMAGWPYDINVKDIGYTTKKIKYTDNVTSCWYLNEEFDYRILRNPRCIECYCKAKPDKDLDHDSENYKMMRASLLSLFFKSEKTKITSKLQDVVISCEKKMVSDDPILNFIGSEEYLKEMERYEMSDSRGNKKINDFDDVKPSDSVILLTHQAPVGSMTSAHMSSKCVEEFHPKDIPDPTAPIDIANGLPRRCGSSALSEAISKISQFSHEGINQNLSKKGNSPEDIEESLSPICYNITCAMNGHTHNPFSNVDTFQGIMMLCPGTLYRGYYMELRLQEDEEGHWRVADATHGKFDVNDLGHC